MTACSPRDVRFLNELGHALLFLGLSMSASSLSDRRRIRKIDLGIYIEKTIITSAGFVGASLIVCGPLLFLTQSVGLSHSSIAGSIAFGLGLLSAIRNEIADNKYFK